MLPLVLLLAAQAPQEVQGLVLAPDGRPLAGATVEGGGRSARTGADGRFRLALAGPATLSVSAPGMEPQSREARPGEPLAVLLQPAARGAVVEVVEGSGYSSQEGSSTTLSRMDIYTTPGAAADVFQAVKALPGVSQASEGAELYVRGGKPEEVGVYLNGGHLARPFHHATTRGSAQGGIFSAVDTALVTHVDFIPGGFSARYGDALSAVLDASTDQPQPVRNTGLLLTLPTQGASLDRPFQTDSGPGVVRASARRSDPVLLDKWYGLAPNFEESPLSHDAQIDVQRPLGSSGRVGFTLLGVRDHLATDIHLANWSGAYRNRNQTLFGALQLAFAAGERWAWKVEASQDRFRQSWSFGSWGMDREEHDGFARVEATFQASTRHGFEAGLDGDRLQSRPQGRVPYDTETRWDPDAPGRSFQYAYDLRRSGAYLTWRWLASDRLGLSLGGRLDRHPRETTRDLRATLSILLREGFTLRLAGGSFHQAPDPLQRDPYAGNPDLRVQRATHAVAALDGAWKGGEADWNLRLELYRKDYDRLVVDDPVRRYDSTGRGYAQGADLLLKRSTPAWRLSLGYGRLDTERREGEQKKLGPVPTSVPHSLTLVSAHTLAPGWELGASFRYASGAPVTPVAGAVPDGAGYRPIEGPAYSDRLPAYGRADLRLTHLFTLGGVRTVAFGEVMNLLNRHNAARYAYSADFSSRRTEESYFSRRILVAGLSLAW